MNIHINDPNGNDYTTHKLDAIPVYLEQIGDEIVNEIREDEEAGIIGGGRYTITVEIER